MIGVSTVTFCACRRWAVVWACALALMLVGGSAGAQPLPSELAEAERMVAEVRLTGNHNVADRDVRALVMTRAGRPFDPQLVQKDARALLTTRKFYDVKVKTQPGPAPRTVIVTFEVFEFPKLQYVRFSGNDTIKSRVLEKESALKKGDPMSLSAVDDARGKIEEFYRKHGYNLVRIQVLEGLNSGDRGAVFMINEGPQQKIWSVEFVGNDSGIVSGGRLMTQIDSKPSLIKYIKGYVDTRKIDEDVDKLTAYYRSLGFFRARISRELAWDASGTWLYLTFVIDEGPRFTVRSVSFSGNQIFGADQLETLVELKPGEFFDQSKMNKAVTSLTDAYGGIGHVMAKIQASPRTLETEPQLDLVFEIAEGSRYRIGRINVRITGDNPHTRQEVVLNRLGFRPGDIADTRKIRDAERRLRAAAVFANDPEHRPRIVLQKAGGDNDASNTASERPRSVRGQSPDGTLEAESPTAMPWLYPEPSDYVAPTGPYWAPAATMPGRQP